MRVLKWFQCQRIFIGMVLTMTLLTFNSQVIEAQFNPRDVYNEPHPNVDPSVCPVCAKIRAMQAARLRSTGDLVIASKQDYDALRSIVPANDGIKLWNRSKTPELGYAQLELHPKTTAVYSDVPRNIGEARLIHGSQTRVNQTSLDLFQAYSKQARAIDLHELRAGTTVSEHLKAQLKTKSKDDLTIIVGHVNGKGEVVFHDKSVLDLRSLSNENGVTWVIGCKTNRFDLGSGLRPQFENALNYRESLSMAGKVQQVLNMPGAKVRDAIAAFAGNDAYITVAIGSGILCTITAGEQSE